MALVFGAGAYEFSTGDSNNFTPLLYPDISKAAGEPYHGRFFTVTVGGKKVICLKSEFHPKRQPSETTLFFDRIVGTSAASQVGCLITSGTSGGIWTSLDVGDVVVTNRARFGLTMPLEQQALQFTGISNIVGKNAPEGFASWYDYVNTQILKVDACLAGGLTAQGGRKITSGPPTIYYEADQGDVIAVVTNSRVSDDECGKIATYRTLGATLDENDAYVASALKAVGFTSWISIRNVSDLPCTASSDDQYDRFGRCSSIAGAYAAWAFIMSRYPGRP